MPDERAGEFSPPELSADGPGEQRQLPRSRGLQWQPPTHQHFSKLLHGVLEDADHREYRLNLGQACWVLMDRTWYRRGRAADAWKLWNNFRYAAAVIPVLAAGAGGSLVGHVHGTAGTTIGWVAIVGGLAGAAVNAVRPAVEYGVDLAKSAQFEQLYWDVFSYSMTGLRTDSLEKIASVLESFAQRMKEIAVTSGSSTGTAS